MWKNNASLVLNTSFIVIKTFLTLYLREEYGERVVLYTPTVIGNVGTDADAPGVTGYYSPSGHRLPNQQRGVNIIRYSDGTSRKVMTK